MCYWVWRRIEPNLTARSVASSLARSKHPGSRVAAVHRKDRRRKGRRRSYRFLIRDILLENSNTSVFGYPKGVCCRYTTSGEHLVKYSVKAFCLSIGFRVVGRRKFSFVLSAVSNVFQNDKTLVS
jgi:hypothetical protein